MKNLLFLVIFLLINNFSAQKPVLHDLKDPKMHAGCYIDGKNNPVANLSEDEGALFNFNGKDEIFPSIKGTKEYPEAFGNKTYKIYIRETKSIKDRESCIENKVYSIKIIYKKKGYHYSRKGMCGC
ncbi:hypothetical protein H9Q08_14615 [Chryseobacterium sp. PS-8]|uniref:DUF4377 domain-containing protein n=1 Tax=Chryseobacterium indicum TaxID=2766954 RepID=A0ABS9C7I1_9FLAO|nr:hypothetical protein [Chryseobacterium sp. PS-8]MCF2220518.1 hypothetical protein [Chryseobacterium sp. PS-8]